MQVPLLRVARDRLIVCESQRVGEQRSAQPDMCEVAFSPVLSVIKTILIFEEENAVASSYSKTKPPSRPTFVARHF